MTASADSNLPSQGYNSLSTEQTLQVGDTQIFGTKVVNETRFQYLRDQSTQTPHSTAPSDHRAIGVQWRRVQRRPDQRHDQQLRISELHFGPVHQAFSEIWRAAARFDRWEQFDRWIQRNICISVTRRVHGHACKACLRRTSSR